MSVAFRRESDEEHLEPKFELPLPPGPNLVTARGLEQIQAKVAELEAGIAQAEDDAAAEPLKRALRYWRTRAATAQLVPVPTGDEVAIGMRVTIRLGGRERVIDIVGHDEADPGADRLAFSAPLAQALIGAMASERVDFAGRAEAIEVLDLRAIP